VASERVYWVDRCLGAEVVPQALRDAGIGIKTYADLYPNDSTSCGKWQTVTNLPNFTVQIVTFGEDFTIQYVDFFEGLP
jgi:hypothetical protein